MRYLVSFFLPFILFSCSSSKERYSPKDEFEKLENIFSTANWKIADGDDTSYWYFSRLGDLNYTMYEFKIIKGDSSVNETSQINNMNNNIIWIRSSDTLKLASADSSTVKWNTFKDDKPAYFFKKLSDDSISLALPAGKQLLMTKTLSLATFLVRSRYDYIHNTHTVDSPLVSHRGKPLGN